MLKNSATKLILIMVLLLFSNFVLAQAPDTLWTKYWHPGTHTSGYAIDSTSDGGVIISGSIYEASGSTYYDIYLIKADSNGDTAWTKVIGGNQWEEGRSVKETLDGGYIIAGYTGDPNSTRWAYIVKTDMNGDTLWTVKNPVSVSEAYYVNTTSDSNYIVTGIQYVSGQGANYLLMKISKNGVIRWTKTYGIAGGDYGKYVQECADGGYFIAGNHYISGGGSNKYLVKTDTSGTEDWSKNYGNDGSHYDYVNSGIQTTDNGYLICGGKFSGVSDASILKINANGDSLWTKYYNIGGISSELKSVCPTKDGGYIFSGYCRITGYHDQMLIIKTNADCDTAWTKICGGLERDWGYSVVQLTDGSYMIAGDTESWVNGTALYLVKLASIPSGLEHEAEIRNPDKFIVSQNYPNPFNPKTNIQFSIHEPGYVTLKVYNARGQELETLVSKKLFTGRYNYTWDATGFASGIYIYKIETQSGLVKTKKLILLK